MNDRNQRSFAQVWNLSVARRTLAVLVVIAVIPRPVCHAAEGGWRNLFGMGGESQAEPEVSDDQLLLGDPMLDPPAEVEEEGWMVSSPFAKVSWPEIKMPKFEFNPPWRSEDSGEGGWLATPLAKARDMGHGAVTRTRTAWNSTIDRMKLALPGGDDAGLDSSPELASDSSPSFLQRMLSPGSGSSSEAPVEVATQPTVNATR